MIEVAFDEGRDVRDSIKFEINEEDPVAEIVAMVSDDGEDTAVVNMTLEEYTEFQRAVNNVGSRIGATGEKALNLEEVFRFLQSRDLDICDNVGPVAPERLSSLIQEWVEQQTSGT